MAEMKYRDFLKGTGATDDQITYNNGNVMLKGKYFGSATPKADGSTYGDVNQLNQAYNAYNSRDAMDKVNASLSKPRQQFSYDPNTDQSYQAALKSAQENIKTGQNNTLANLAARGQGQSSYSATVAQQIANKEMGNVSNNILPQLMQQAYGRFHDQQVMDGQDIDRQLKVAGTYSDLGQQDFNNNRLTEQDTRQKRLDNMAVKQWYEQQYGVPIEAKDDWSLVADQVKGLKPLDMRKYEDGRADVKFNQDYQTRSLENTIRNTDALITDRQTDNARQAASATASAAKKTEAATAKAEKETANQGKISTAQFNDIYSTLQKRYGVVSYKKDKNNQVVTDSNGNPTVSYTNTNNPDQKAKLVFEIANSGISHDQMLQLLNKFGITENEADALLGG